MASDPIDQLGAYRKLKGEHARLEAENAILKQGGGGGTSGGMEARVAKLEAHIEHVRDDLGRLAGVPADLASLKGDSTGLRTDFKRLEDVPTKLGTIQNEVSNLPTKDYLGQQFDRQFRWTTGLIILVSAVVGAVAKLI